jgi:Domain of unknown function (DUF1814).
VQFQRPQHNIILSALHSMDADLLARTNCFFGGGTAIVLLNGEYRLSLDVDFLCSDVDGYRELRSVLPDAGASAIFGPGVETLREFRADQYGIRGLVSLEGQRIKFEIVRESRIPLEGSLVAELGVPVLSVEHQFAEKLLANADRVLDKAVANRDAIDLGYLVITHGCIPAEAIKIAEIAYGPAVFKAMVQGVQRLEDKDLQRHAADTLEMSVESVGEAARALREAAQLAWGTDIPHPETELPEP